MIPFPASRPAANWWRPGNGIVHFARRSPTTCGAPALFCPDEASGITVFMITLPGCASQGDTIGHARQMIAEAFKLTLESYLADGKPIPWQEDKGVYEDAPADSWEEWIEVEVDPNPTDQPTLEAMGVR